MEDFSIVPGQTILEVLFALLLILVTSYVYISCKLYAERAHTAHLSPVKTLCSPGTEQNRESSSPSSERARSQKRGSSIKDWLAPIVAWSAVIWVTLAVVSILLGEN